MPLDSLFEKSSLLSISEMMLALSLIHANVCDGGSGKFREHKKYCKSVIEIIVEHYRNISLQSIAERYIHHFLFELSV